MPISTRLLADRYELRDAIGDGGMGRVWLGFDQMLCRKVAVKQVVPPPGLSPEQLERLGELVFREAQAAAQIDHPNVVQVYDVVQSGQWPWIVMQYVRSRTLRDVVRTTGPLRPLDAARIGLCLLDALEATHRAGVLHRDLTPQNVLIADDHRVMLADFGVALWPHTADIDEPDLMGTAQYVAPERVVTGQSTPAGDYWSLGATLYLAVEGRSPYARPTVTETLSALVTVPPDPPRRAAKLATLLLGLLEREPRLRPTATETRRMLTQVAAGPAESLPRLTSAMRHEEPAMTVGAPSGQC